MRILTLRGRWVPLEDAPGPTRVSLFTLTDRRVGGILSPVSRPAMSHHQTKRYGQVDEDPSVHITHLGKMVEYYAGSAVNYNQWHCDPANDSPHNYAVREILSLMQDT